MEKEEKLDTLYLDTGERRGEKEEGSKSLFLNEGGIQRNTMKRQEEIELLVP